MLAQSSRAVGAEEISSKEFVFGDKEFRSIAALVHKHTGIVLGAHKKTMVYSRLVRRLRALGLASFKDYCAYLNTEDGTKELGALINAITTNLTKFFREAHHFDHLRDTAIPEIIRRDDGKRRLRIWSSACSTGEEPYSIAMIVAHQAQKLAGWDTRILATDLDTAVLGTAKRGQYEQGVEENVPSILRRLYMQHVEAEACWEVDQVLRDLIVFNQLNLLGNWPIKGLFDVIFCRNVLIYFDGPTKKRVVERLAEKLTPGGWLYLGHSETLLDHHANLKLVGRTIYQKV